MAVLVWTAIYPTITIFFALAGSLLEHIPVLPLRTLVSTMVVVPLMVYFIVPFLSKRFQRWLEH